MGAQRLAERNRTMKRVCDASAKDPVVRWRQAMLALVAIAVAGSLLDWMRPAHSQEAQMVGSGPAGEPVSGRDMECAFAVYRQPGEIPFASFPNITEELLGRTPVVDLTETPAGTPLWFEPIGGNVDACLERLDPARIRRLLLRHGLTESRLVAVANIRGLEGLALAGKVTGGMLEGLHSRSTLRELTLDGNVDLFSAQSARELAHIETLSLTGSPKDPAALSESIGRLPALRRLVLSGWEPSDADLRRLLRSRRIEALSIDAGGMSPSGLATLGSLDRLRSLFVSWGITGPTPAAVQALRGLHAVERLHLLLGLQMDNDANTPAANCLAALGELENLRELAVSYGGRVGPRNVLALKHLTHLRTLGLSDRHLSDDVLDAIGQLTSLEVLLLSGEEGTGNHFDESAVRHLAGLRRLRVLDIGNSPLVGDAAVAVLGGFPLLEKLDLSHTGVTADGVSHLENLESLVVLSLPAGASNDAALRHVAAHCPRLRELNLDSPIGESGVTATGLAPLARLPHLRSLLLSKIDDKAVAELARLRSIERLFLFEGEGITDKGLAALAALPRLHTLSICNMFAPLQITPQGFEALMRSPSLVRLEIEGVTWSSEEIEQRLHEALRLGSVSIRRPLFDEIRNGLAATPAAPTPGSESGAASPAPR
jgi:hypothetical protein